MPLLHLPDAILFFSLRFYFSLLKTLSLASMIASLDENCYTVCNFHVQLCFSLLQFLTCATLPNGFVSLQSNSSHSTAILFVKIRLASVQLDFALPLWKNKFLSITSNDSFLVYFVFYNYGFASFHVQYFISLSFDFLLLSTHCFQNIDFASFLVHIKGVFSCVSRNKTHLKAHKCLFLRLKDIFASAIGVLWVHLKDIFNEFDSVPG